MLPCCEGETVVFADHHLLRGLLRGGAKRLLFSFCCQSFTDGGPGQALSDVASGCFCCWPCCGGLCSLPTGVAGGWGSWPRAAAAAAPLASAACRRRQPPHESGLELPSVLLLLCVPCCCVLLSPLVLGVAAAARRASGTLGGFCSRSPFFSFAGSRCCCCVPAC